MTEKEIRKKFKKICKDLGIPCKKYVDLPTSTTLSTLFDKQYQKEYFDDDCEGVHIKEGFIAGILTQIALTH